LLLTTNQLQSGVDSGHESNGGKTRLSVGIAAFNEAANIGRLIERIQLDIGEKGQVVVVCSGCTDKTAEIVAGYSNVDPRVRLVIEEDRNGKSSAINKILSEFIGGMLLLVSADVLPQAGCIPAMVSAMESDPSIGVVSSRPHPVNGNHNLTGHLGHLYWRLHHETLSLLDANNQNTHGGEAILVRRGVVSSIPSDCINDDAYIGVQAVLRGFRVRYCPEAQVRTRTPDRITELIGQRRRIIAGHARVKRHTGKYPMVLTTMSFQKPSKFVQVLTSELRSHPRSLPSFLVALYLEAVSCTLAIIDGITDHDHVVWNPATTTKLIADR
jgi:cellulose synthase/poly-beta-1,6-N-acetylglucosamine synthase-like glycosyltransferase